MGVRASVVQVEIPSANVEHQGKYCQGPDCRDLPKSVSSIRFASSRSFLWSRKLSSEAGAKSSDKEDDLEDGFSDLEVPPETDNAEDVKKKEGDEDLLSEGEIAVEEEEESDEVVDNSIDLSDTESDAKSDKILRKKNLASPLFKIIMDSPRHNMSAALEKWVEEGNELGRSEVFVALLNLRKRKLYAKALQVFTFSQLYL